MAQIMAGGIGQETPDEDVLAATSAWSTRVIIATDRVIYRIAKNWLVFANGLFATYVASLFLAPALAAAGRDSLAQPIYAFHGLFCHQRADRSFAFLGEKMACCERCAAIYGAILIVALVFAALRGRVRKPFLYEVGLLALPAVVDGGAQAAGLWESTPGSRVLSGSFLGVAICWFALPFLETGFGRIREQVELLFARLVAEGRAKPL